jgi:hypothetical protein
MSMLGMSIPGISIRGRPVCSSWRLALGVGGPKEFGAARGPLRFQRGVALQAFPAVEQKPGEGIDGDSTRENFAHDLAIAFGLAVAKVSLALRLLALFCFLQAPPFLGRLHLCCIIGGSFSHKTSPSGRGQKLPGAPASGGDVFANGRKKFWVAIRRLLWLDALPAKPALLPSRRIIGLAPVAGVPENRVILTCGA